METVSSVHNPKIKRLLALQQKSAARQEAGLFVVEGMRELLRCLDAGYVADTLFCCPELVRQEDMPELEKRCRGLRRFYLTPEVYARAAYRGGTEGVLAEIRIPQRGLDTLALSENPLIAVLEKVEKPGNLGAVLRCADAAGADAVLVCDPLTDLYNPNLIRASVGAVFSVPAVACRSEEAIAFLKSRRIRILTAQLQDSSPYYACDMRGGTAIVMGAEDTGLTDCWRKAADAHVLIPMRGRVDSLNVSVSAAILLYEAVRQRRS
ncbi:MAG: RNA methyltransferase [Bacteroidales bacterium]|nr:RNA methyltransferase [Bacteroidales bacterium]